MESKISYHLQGIISEIKDMISEEVFSSVQKAINSQGNKSVQETEILTIDEVVEEFKISKSHINNLRNRYEDFPIIRIDKAIRYDRNALKVFFTKNTFTQNEG